MSDTTRLYVLLAVFFSCPLFGVAATIHKKLKNRRKAEIRTIIQEAKARCQESIDLQTSASLAEAKAAQAETQAAREALAQAKVDLTKWKHTHKEPLERYAKTIAAFTPTGSQLLLDERLSLPDLIERVTTDAVGGRVGYQGVKVARGERGFEVTLTFAKSLEWSNKTAIMKGIRQLKQTIDPRWISDLRFAKAGASPVSVGPLQRLTDDRLTALMAAYYTTKSARLPDPNIVGRRSHAEAAWQIKNGTGRNIAVSYFGPSQGTVNLAPKQVKEIKFKPGQYFISVKATDAGSRVTPYSGSTNYKGGYLYSSEWIIRSRWSPNIPGLPYRPRRR